MHGDGRLAPKALALHAQVTQRLMNSGVNSSQCTGAARRSKRLTVPDFNTERVSANAVNFIC